jgi:hypothetical protein
VHVRRFLRVLPALPIVLVGLCSSRTAAAHAPESSLYSRYEATTSGYTIAFVFAFPTRAILPLVSTLADKTVDRDDLASYQEPLSRYLFDRFSVANDGELCEHPPQVTQFFWDAPSNQALAVTKFVCRSKLAHLTIRSRVTHDMPVAHELVGDLRHGRTLVRSFFAAEDAEANIDLSSLTPGAPPGDEDVRRSARKGVPDRERRHEDLASKALGVDLSDDAGANSRTRRAVWLFVAMAAAAWIVVRVRAARSGTGSAGGLGGSGRAPPKRD